MEAGDGRNYRGVGVTVTQHRGVCVLCVEGERAATIIVRRLGSFVGLDPDTLRGQTSDRLPRSQLGAAGTDE